MTDARSSTRATATPGSRVATVPIHGTSPSSAYGGAEEAWLLPDGQTVAVLQGQVMWNLAPDGGRRPIALGADQEAV